MSLATRESTELLLGPDRNLAAADRADCQRLTRHPDHLSPWPCPRIASVRVGHIAVRVVWVAER